MSTAIMNTALYNFWIDDAFKPNIAEALNMVFWKCSVDQVLAMSDPEIIRRLNESSLLNKYNRILALRCVQNARNRRPHSTSLSMANQYFV